jgi:hypothetical protein
VPLVIREPTGWEELMIMVGIGVAGVITGTCFVLLLSGRF